MFNWIQNFLNRKLFQRKHEVLKLQWEKARLEQQLKALQQKQ